MDNPMLAELDEVKWLRDAAAGIALEGHAGWGNACIFGAECIERLQSTLADMAKRLEAAERDARRWRHARKLLTADDIEGAQGSYDSFGGIVSEDECKRADAAIDAATQEGER